MAGVSSRFVCRTVVEKDVERGNPARAEFPHGTKDKSGLREWRERMARSEPEADSEPQLTDVDGVARDQQRLQRV